MDISNLRLSTLIWSFICCLQCPAPETSNIGRGWGPMWPFLGVRGIMEKWGETSDGFRADHERQKVLMPSHLVQGHRCRRRVFNCEIAQNEGTNLVFSFLPLARHSVLLWVCDFTQLRSSFQTSIQHCEEATTSLTLCFSLAAHSLYLGKFSFLQDGISTPAWFCTRSRLQISWIHMSQ